jgi:hypothetical protein
MPMDAFLSLSPLYYLGNRVEAMQDTQGVLDFKLI